MPAAPFEVLRNSSHQGAKQITFRQNTASPVPGGFRGEQIRMDFTARMPATTRRGCGARAGVSNTTSSAFGLCSGGALGMPRQPSPMMPFSAGKPSIIAATLRGSTAEAAASAGSSTLRLKAHCRQIHRAHPRYRPRAERCPPLHGFPCREVSQIIGPGPEFGRGHIRGSKNSGNTRPDEPPDGGVRKRTGLQSGR